MWISKCMSSYSVCRIVKVVILESGSSKCNGVVVSILTADNLGAPPAKTNGPIFLGGQLSPRHKARYSRLGTYISLKRSMNLDDGMNSLANKVN